MENQNNHTKELAFVDTWMQSNNVDVENISRTNLGELLHSYTGVIRTQEAIEKRRSESNNEECTTESYHGEVKYMSNSVSDSDLSRLLMGESDEA